MKVFISWSGSRSKEVAIALRKWLKNVIQTLEPWLSDDDIDKGTRWSTDIAHQLAETRVGIICLTAENLTAPWILFEAGALSKTLDQTYVCTYLIEIDPADVEGPLSQFQATRANKEDTKKLIRTINKARGDVALSDETIDGAFEKWWPDLEQSLNSLSKSNKTFAVKRDQRELVEELLELARGHSRILDEIKEAVGSSSAPLKTQGGEQESKYLHGREMTAIKVELERRKKPLLLMALEEANSKLIRIDREEWELLAVYRNENTFSRRLRESSELFSDIGKILFGAPITISVEIINEAPPSEDENREGK